MAKSQISFALFVVCVILRGSSAAPVNTTDSTGTNATEVCELQCVWGMKLDITECKCICEHEANENDATRFYMLFAGQRFDMPCSVGLVWSQEACACGYPKITVTTPEPKNGPSSQITCTTLINYALDASTNQYTDGKNYVDLENDVNPIQVVAVDGATVNDLAADFSYNSISIPYLQGNDLTKNAFVEARFQPLSSSDNVTRVVLSNGCPDVALPSVMLSQNGMEDKIYVAIRTEVESSGVCENVKPDAFGWYKVTVSVENSITTVQVNDVQCLSLSGQGSIATTPCGLTIGGDPYRQDYELDFNGYIDYVKVIKHCSTDSTTPQ